MLFKLTENVMDYRNNLFNGKGLVQNMILVIFLVDEGG